MTRILSVAVTALAVCALASTADAGTRKRHAKVKMQQTYVQEPYGYAYRPDSRFDRRDPLSWSAPLNAWDKARRDDANLKGHD